MSHVGSVAGMATSKNIARLGLGIAGAMAMAWAVAVFPVLWSEQVIADVGTAVMAGEAFKPNVLAAVETLTESDRGFKLRSSVLGKAAVIRLRQAEDAMRGGPPELVNRRLDSLAQILDETFRNAPADSLMWLTKYWLDTTRNGLRPDNLRFLRMSYELGPNEGWIAIKRNGLALAAFSILPGDLAEQAVSEFVGLVRWGLDADAAAIAAGPGLPLRQVLFSQLEGLNYEQRRAFANAIYGREVYDVPVPGIAPPTPKIPMPVMPPDL